MGSAQAGPTRERAPYIIPFSYVLSPRQQAEDELTKKLSSFLFLYRCDLEASMLGFCPLQCVFSTQKLVLESGSEIQAAVNFCSK